MCGIAGVISFGEKIRIENLLPMRDALTHRGPDDAGTWICKNQTVALLHRRLSIIDLSDNGHQPMANHDESIVVAFNGEIYNFKILRDELIKKGYAFRSNSDTEVIIHAYEEWGLDAIKLFNGMFALALYDRVKNTLLLARDRFGEKPLYYTTNGTYFAFASELKSICKLPYFSPQINYELLPQYLLFGYVPYPHSIFNDVKKMAPGQYLLMDITNSDYQLYTYWDPINPQVEYREDSAKLDEAADELESLLTDSVRMRLNADVPVGTLLSGGIDSSLITCLAVKCKSNINTFSIGFADKKYDEAPYAKRIAEHIGTEHHEYYVSPHEAMDTLMQMPQVYDEPFADSSAIPTYLVSSFARKHVKVVLSGDGGDELFAGYNTYPRLTWLGEIMKLPSFMRKTGAAIIGMLGPQKWKRHIDFLDIQSHSDAYLYANERMTMKVGDVHRAGRHFDVNFLAQSEFIAAFNKMFTTGFIEAGMYTDTKTYLPEDILTKVDRASMANSLEMRVPFLDYRVSNFAMSLPLNFKMGRWGQGQKIILKKLLNRYVPAAFFERPKRGFNLPIAHWLRGDMKWLIEEYLSEERVRSSGIFQPEFIRKMVDEHLRGERNRDAALWTLISWEMWRDRWGY